MLDEIPRIFEAVFECTLDVSTPPSTLLDAPRAWTQMHLEWGDDSDRNVPLVSSDDLGGPLYPPCALDKAYFFETFSHLFLTSSSSDTITKKNV